MERETAHGTRHEVAADADEGSTVETDGTVGAWVAEDSRAGVEGGRTTSGRKRRDRAPTRSYWPSVLAGVVVSAPLPLDGISSGALVLVAASAVAGAVHAGGFNRGASAGAVAAPAALLLAMYLDGWFDGTTDPLVAIAASGLVVVPFLGTVGVVCGGIGGILGATEPLAPRRG